MPQRLRSLPVLAQLAVAISVIITLITLIKLPLFYQDEAAYAGFGLTIIQTDNWVIPEFMWSDIHRKPPLYFWMIAISYKLFGVSDFSMRLPAFLSLSGVYALLIWSGRRWFSYRIAWLWVAVLSTSLFVPLTGRMALVDAPLLLASTGAAISIYALLQPQASRWPILFFWVSVSAGIMLKGPPIIIFTGLLWLGLLITHKNRWHLIRLHPWFFGPLSLVPFIYWITQTIALDSGVLAQWMLEWYVLKRLTGSTLGHWGPPGYYVLTFILFFAPYSVFLPSAIKQARRYSIMLAWFIAGWLFYEFSPSKLPSYVIVSHVPLSFFIAVTLDRYATDRYLAWPRLSYTLYAIMAIIWAGILLIIPIYFQVPHTLIAVISITSLSLLVVWRLIPGSLIYATGFGFILWLVIMPAASRVQTAPRDIVKQFQHLPSDTPVFIVNTNYEPTSLPAYLNRQFSVVRLFDRNTSIDQCRRAAHCLFILSDNDTHMSNLQAIFPTNQLFTFGNTVRTKNLPILQYTVMHVRPIQR